MPLSSRVLLCFLLTAAFALSGSSSVVSAKWKVVATFKEPVGCGFFWDAEHGLVGTGRRNILNAGAMIYKTTDGGTTWTPTKPATNVSGGITSIFMADQLNGYATFFQSSPGPIQGSTLWVTSDGGNTWTAVPNTRRGGATCVYATTSSVIMTLWGAAGGVAN